EQGVGGDDGL
nr:RecName: Full=Polyphenol oxidase; Short=PPO; AltName: Full=Catechol oxidase [Zingiber officinale]